MLIVLSLNSFLLLTCVILCVTEAGWFMPEEDEDEGTPLGHDNIHYWY